MEAVGVESRGVSTTLLCLPLSGNTARYSYLHFITISYQGIPKPVDFLHRVELFEASEIQHCNLIYSFIHFLRKKTLKSIRVGP